MFKLVETGELPESYDVYLAGEPVGAVRVAGRHRLVAALGDEAVYSARIEGIWRTTPDERDRHLSLSCGAILGALASEGVGALYELAAEPPAVRFPV